MKKQLLLAAGAFALVAGSTTAATAQDKKVNFRLSYWVPPSHMLTPGYKEWGDYLKEKSGGTINITLFPSSQLGSGKDHYDMVKRGIADIGLINPGYTPGRFPVEGAIDLPFLVSEPLNGARAMTRWYEKYASKEMPDVKVCHTFSHEPGTFHAVKEIKLPADIKGMKIRTGNATLASYVTLLGGNSVQVPIMEAYETLKRGITEGITVPWDGLISFRFGDVAKYSIDMPMYVSSFVHTVNLRKYNSMSAAQKKIFDETCTPEWSKKIYRFWSAKEDASRKKLIADPKHNTYTPTKEDVAKWRASVEPVYKQWRDAVTKAGYNPETVLNELKAELKKDNALYE